MMTIGEGKNLLAEVRPHFYDDPDFVASSPGDDTIHSIHDL